MQENLAFLIGEKLFTGFSHLHTLIILWSSCQKKQFLIFKGHNITDCFQTKAQILLYYCYLRHNGALATANNCTNMLPKCFKKSWKAKRYIHANVIHALSSPQFLSYHERSLDPLARFEWNNSQDKEMLDLLTSSITITDLKISQAEVHWSCCWTKPCRK